MKLEVRDLAVAFGDREVARVPELTIESGESVGIAGESGSGKSTTAFAILGLSGRLGARVSGSIKLDGVELVGAPESQLREIRGRRISMIFQSPSTAFNPVMRIEQTFFRTLALHGFRSRDEQRRQAESSLAQAHLGPHVLRRYPHELSGGELQRVAIAVALALHSELLLADEPTSALDVTVQAEVLEIIREIRRSEGMGLLLISHDLAVVTENTDRLLIMQDGRVVEAGPTGSILEAPTEAYTQALFDAVPALSSTDGAA